ncbi:hypothetical protein Tco_0700076 [Tanacetum coccineum]
MVFFFPSPTPCGGSDLLLGETYTLLSNFNDSSPDYETFCFDIGDKSNGRTTSHSDHSLPEYESFHFDLLIDPLPPADRSDSHLEEFADCADIAKITRKRLKPGKYEHGNGRARKETGESYQKSKVVNSSQPLVNLSQKSRGKSQLDTGQALAHHTIVRLT